MKDLPKDEQHNGSIVVRIVGTPNVDVGTPLLSQHLNNMWKILVSILFLKFKIAIALLRGSHYKHYPHWLTSLQHSSCLLSITEVYSKCDSKMFLSVENYSCV
jgi:hypothetical protein